MVVVRVEVVVLVVMEVAGDGDGGGEEARQRLSGGCCGRRVGKQQVGLALVNYVKSDVKTGGRKGSGRRGGGGD